MERRVRLRNCRLRVFRPVGRERFRVCVPLTIVN